MINFVHDIFLIGSFIAAAVHDLRRFQIALHRFNFFVAGTALGNKRLRGGDPLRQSGGNNRTKGGWFHNGPFGWLGENMETRTLYNGANTKPI